MKRLITRVFTAINLFILSAMAAITAGATSGGGGGLDSSVVVTGTTKLLNDAMTAGLIIAPVVGGVVIIYFCIRRGMSDEMDQKKWNNRIVTAIISTVGAVIAVSLLGLIIGYYQ